MRYKLFEYDWSGKRVNASPNYDAPIEDNDVETIVGRVMRRMGSRGSAIVDFFTGETLALNPGRSETWQHAFCRSEHYAWVGREVFERELRELLNQV